MSHQNTLLPFGCDLRCHCFMALDEPPQESLRFGLLLVAQGCKEALDIFNRESDRDSASLRG